MWCVPLCEPGSCHTCDYLAGAIQDPTQDDAPIAAWLNSPAAAGADEWLAARGELEESTP